MRRGAPAMASLLLAVSCGAPVKKEGLPLVVAAVSCESRIRDTEFNLSRIEHWAREAASAGADLVLFPECTLHAWWQSRENRRYAERVDGASIERLTRLAAELDVVLAVGMTELDGDSAFITHVILDADGVIGRHRKTQLAGGESGEERVWERGDDVTVFRVRGHDVGIAICYESVHSETCASLTAAGARVILAPYANGTRPAEITDPERRARRWIWQRARENHVWYVACDATPHGEDGTLQPGAAYVIDPLGRLVACTPEDGPGEAMVVCAIPAQARDSTRSGSPTGG